MAPRLAIYASAAFVLASLPAGLAGPACAQQYYQQADCVSKCKTRWGWAGFHMGTDRWGSVVDTASGQSLDNAIAIACGSSAAPAVAKPTTTSTSTSTSSTAEATSTTAIPVVNVVTTPTSTSSTTSTRSTTSIPTTTQPSTADFVVASVRPSTTSTAPATRPTITKSSFTRLTTQRAPPATSTPRVVTTARPQTSQAPVTQPSSGDAQIFLTEHNNARALHGASPLVWSEDLASKAALWASGCKMEHSGGKLGRLGENLAAGTGSYSIESAVKGWVDEKKIYNPANPTSGQVGHFTQVVWKATTQLGCAVQTGCTGIFDASFGPARLIVCEYSTAGNVIGQFAQNVQA